MGNNFTKSRLVMECPKEELFAEFCKFIHAFTKDVDCLYFINKNYMDYSNTKKCYESQVIFKLKKFKSLIFIWKTLCSWNKLTDNQIKFQLLANIQNHRFMEFNNDIVTLDTGEKPEHFDSYFAIPKYKNKHT
jgi:hypothetical protein